MNNIEDEQGQQDGAIAQDGATAQDGAIVQEASPLKHVYQEIQSYVTNLVGVCE